MTIPIAGFGSEGGSLTVGGMPVDRLADRVGGTPFFAYDRALLNARIELLREQLPADVGLSYAIKANPMPAVVQHLSGIVDSLDVASAAEMQTAGMLRSDTDLDELTRRSFVTLPGVSDEWLQTVEVEKVPGGQVSRRWMWQQYAKYANHPNPADVFCGLCINPIN